MTHIWFHMGSKDRWYHNSLNALQGRDNLSLKIKQTVSTHYNHTWLKFSELCTTLYRFSHAPDQKKSENDHYSYPISIFQGIKHTNYNK